MGFLFASGGKASNPIKGNPSTNLLHRLECRACPMDNADVRSPKIEPHGSKEPIVYLLGDFPDEQDDRQGSFFCGDHGELIRNNIPLAFRNDVRFGNVVRTMPVIKNSREIGEPSFVQIEACRPSIIRDIEKSKPNAIFGFGNIPLNWMVGIDGAHAWRGRKLPVKVGKHVCWYYPFYDPRKLVQEREEWGAKNEHIFALDIARAFEEMEFDHFVPEYHDREEIEKNCHWVLGGSRTDLKVILQELKWFADQDMVGVDLECTKLRPYNSDAKILTVALGTPDRSFAFPICHPKARWSASDIKIIMDALEGFLRHPKPLKVVHNLAFEMEWFAFHFGSDILRCTQWGDSIQLAFLLDERYEMLGLGIQTLEHFGTDIKKLSNIDVKNLINEPVLDVLKYNVVDAKYHCLVFQKLMQRIVLAGKLDVYKMHMRRLAPVVLTQLKGINISQKQNKIFQIEYGEKIADIENKLAALPELAEFKRLMGYSFEPSKNQHTLSMVDKVLKLKDKDGKAYTSSDEKVLSLIKHPFASLMLQWRRASKLKSTYIDPLSTGGEFVYEDGKLHPNLNTIKTDTGRLSSDSPNEQNFPKRKGKEIRKQIIAPKKHFIVPIDYGQIEARVIAMMSKDKVFVKALWERYDVHTEWAERIAHAYPSRIGGKQFLKDKVALKKLRDDVKNQWTFPLFFGAKLRRVAAELKIPENVLEPLVNEFWRTFSGVREWQIELDDFYEANGFVTTLTGRDRHGPMSPNQYYNAPVQGTMADIVLDAMDRISILAEDDWNLQPIMNVHDDLTFIFPEDEIEYYSEIAVTEMLRVPFDFINVPITVELSIGRNWAEIEEMATYSNDQWFGSDKAA